MGRRRGTRNGLGSRSLVSSQGTSVSQASAEWTVDEEEELIRQLMTGYSRDYSSTYFQKLLWPCYTLMVHAAEARYLAILNTRLLQNKLPEHVRERALSLKIYLLEVFGPLEWIESIKK